MDTKELKHYSKLGLEILQLNEEAAKQAAGDKKATTYAILFIALAGVAGAIGSLNLPWIIFFPIFLLIFTLIGIGILHLFAKLFGGKAKFVEFYRASGIAHIWMWIAAIPILGSILFAFVSLWYIIVCVKIVKAVHNLTTGKAVLVVAIPVILSIILGLILAVALAALFYAFISEVSGGLTTMDYLY